MTDAYDVIVVGFGYAGGVAAIAAHDAGARVLCLEKRQRAGRHLGLFRRRPARHATDADEALAYLEATNAGTTPRARAARRWREGMTALPAYIGRLARTCRRDASSARPRRQTIRFPVYDSFGFVYVDDASRLRSRRREFPAVRGSPAGARLFKVVRATSSAAAHRDRAAAAPPSGSIVENGAVRGVAPAAGPSRRGAASCSRLRRLRGAIRHRSASSGR